MNLVDSVLSSTATHQSTPRSIGLTKLLIEDFHIMATPPEYRPCTIPAVSQILAAPIPIKPS